MKVLSPFVYAATVLLTTPLIFVVARITDYYTAPPLVTVIAELLLGSVAFGFYSWALLRLERGVRPNVWDHIRHCTLLYACVIPMGPLWFATLSIEDPGGGGALVMLGIIIASYAIVVNALTMFWQRRRYARIQPGGAV